MRKVVTILGARPQFVKAAVVSRAMREHGGLSEVMVHTGQHYDSDMSDVFFEQLGIPAPLYNLHVQAKLHGEMTAAMIAESERVLMAERPDSVLLYGDTNSTLAGAVAASKLQIPIAHVEAGLRSFNRRMPEEINRKVTDHLSALLFAPSSNAVRNLAREGIEGPHVFNVGDVMYDLVRQTVAAMDSRADADLSPARRESASILVTIHRAENTDDPVRLQAIVKAVQLASKRHKVVWPMHPRTAQAIQRSGIPIEGERVQVLKPVGYLQMVALLRDCSVVVTDSGGLQKEAYFLRKPCVTLRSETEWVELVDAGWNVVIEPCDPNDVAMEILGRIGTLGRDSQLYGDGHAGDAIAAIIARHV